jgi:hypothetical protein
LRNSYRVFQVARVETLKQPEPGAPVKRCVSLAAGIIVLHPNSHDFSDVFGIIGIFR